MKYEFAKTKNVMRFLGALDDLVERPHGVEGMGLLYGQPGEGKSTVIARFTNSMDGVYVRANACWTVTAMLQILVSELGGIPRARRAPMVTDIIKRLNETQRPIFVDEADYLLRQADMLDTLRDIYDSAGVPVIFIGMEELGRKLAGNGRFARFARRITQWIEFAGIDIEDARLVADTVCEVGIDDDLLEHLYKETRANIGRMVTGLSLIEKLGRTNKLGTVTRKDWGKKPLYYDQPNFVRRGR